MTTPRSRLRTLVAALLVVGLTAGTSACGVTRGGDEPGNRRLRMMIPNSPGGGYDQTGRAAVHVMEDEDLTGRFEVSNVIGASGSVAMQRLLNEDGADDLMMTMGLGVVGAVYTNKSAARVTDSTPARPAHRGAGGPHGPRRLPVRDRRRPGGGLEGRPELGRRSAAAPPPAGPTTSSRCSWPTPSASSPATSATSPTTAAAR